MLIGIAGKKRTGKDTAAGIIRTFYATQVHTMAFAERLKAICSLTFDVPLKAFYDQDKKEEVWGRYGTPRDMMTKMADMIKSQYGEDFFVDVVRANIEDLKRNAPHDFVVITDVRHPNEVAMIREFGGVIIALARDTDATSTHQSEAGLGAEYVDEVVPNNGTLEDFRSGLFTAVMSHSPITHY